MPVPRPVFRAVPDDAPHLVRHLDEIASRHPLARKVILAPARGAGRELLRTLARMRGGWSGFVVETPRPFALQIATPALARAGLRVMDEFEEEALVDETLDDAMASGAGEPYRELAGGMGFRRAVRSAVAALRIAGVEPARIRREPFADRAKQDLLASVLEGLAARSAERGVADVGQVLRLAAEALEAGAPLGADSVHLWPGLSMRGASGRFLRALLDRGAWVLTTDPVMGLEAPAALLWHAGRVRTPRSFLCDPEAAPRVTESPPDDTDTSGLPLFDGADAPTGPAPASITLFRAAGIQEEIREVLRRALGSSTPFEDVEIVTPDPGVYGPALHALATRLGIPVTFAVGLPVERTRPGRAVASYLRWISDDFPAAEIRRLLENDDLRAPGAHRHLNPRALARTLRRLRVGWGRERYAQILDAALERLESRPPEPRRDESPEEHAARLERMRANLEGVQALLRYILRHTPADVPRRLELRPRPVAPAEVAGGLARFLRLVPTRSGSVDDAARDRLLRVLDRIRATLTRPVPFGAAVATVQEHLELRVPAPRAEGKAPWLSDGGSVHLTDLEHGGLSGRPLTFLVGLDAGRFPGGGTQDPLLLDRERRRLSGDLPTSADRLEERQFRLAALLARVRGEVVMSYPAWDAAEARVLAPSPVLLQAYRLASGDPQAGFDALRGHLGTPASRLPRSGSSLDREDVWLEALSGSDHLLEGTRVVRDAFPRLDAGIAARRAWDGAEPGAHQGVVGRRTALDPRQVPETILSASRLEALGACPLRYFHRYVLHLQPLDDPDYQPDAWLDPLRRGSLLHGVFETTLRAAREDGIAVEDSAFVELGHRILHGDARTLRQELPPPSEAVFQRELAALEVDVRCFADHLRLHPPAWEDLELQFGFEGGEPPVLLELAGGTVRLRGAVDRVDAAGADGSHLRIVDYKTGSFGRHWARSTGVYNGGRRLQHVLYTLAVEALKARPVEAMEYHFPTRKGEGEIRRFQRRELTGGAALVDRLLDGAAQGHFVPTDTVEDCAFCDYKAICRVTEGRFGRRDSPPAQWGEAQREAGAPAYRELDAVRSWEERPD